MGGDVVILFGDDFDAFSGLESDGDGEAEWGMVMVVVVVMLVVMVFMSASGPDRC